MDDSKIGTAEFEIIQHKKKALLFGATGLVGGALLKQLCMHQAYSEIISFGRKKTNANHPKLKQYVIDFDQLDEHAHLLKGQDVFIAIGTTIKKAGSQEAFEKIDHDLVFRIAKKCSLNEVSQLILVSSVGADTESLFFYSRVKGAVERDVQKLPFWACHIIRPSLLLGERGEKRPLEKMATMVGQGLKSTIGHLFGRYNPIEAKVVAKAMVAAAQQFKEGKYIYQSPQIEELADKV